MATGGLDDTDISNDLKMFEGPDSTIKFCGPCKHDNREETAAVFCIACCEYLCKTCCREHYKHKVKMYHVILKDQDLPEDIAPFWAIKELMKCSVHTNEDVSHECVDHSCLICAICIKEEHRQCGEVKKLGSENGKDANDSDLKNIASLQIKAMNCKLRSECNIFSQLVEKETADIKNRDLKSKTIARIEKINFDLQNKLKLSCNSDIHTISDASAQQKLIEGELNELKNIASIMSEHGSTAEREVVSKYVSKRVGDVASKLECLENATILNCSANTIGVQNPTIENSSDDVMNEDVLDTSDKKYTGCSSDNFSHSDQGTQTDDKHCNMEKNRKVHQASNTKRPFIIAKVFRATSYQIRTHTDRHTCDVLALQQLSDGRFLLADQSNKKLKLFDKQFRLIRELRLPDYPTDLCINQRGIFVCFSSSRFIHRYTIDGESKIYESTKFPTRYQAVSLDAFGDERILILFLKVGMYDDSYNDDVVIEVRDGSAIVASLEYPNGDYDFKYAEDAKRICTISPSTFILAEDERVSCYSFDMEDEYQEEREWYYKSHGNTCLQKARGMCLDSEGNVYVCGEYSYNVHQISLHDYRKNRVLIENVREPVAVVMDECQDRLIVSCRNDDCLHVFCLK